MITSLLKILIIWSTAFLCFLDILFIDFLLENPLLLLTIASLTGYCIVLVITGLSEEDLEKYTGYKIFNSLLK